MVPRRHGSVRLDVVVCVTASAAPPRPLSLRIVLDELERSGAGSLEFWRVYWAALPHLTEAELFRVARAVGPAGRASLRTLRDHAYLPPPPTPGRGARAGG